MGGLALKNAFTRRVNTKEMYAICQKLFEGLNKLPSLSGIGRYRLDEPYDFNARAPHIYMRGANGSVNVALVPRYFGDKDSFGDVDMLVCSELFDGVDIRKFIQTSYRPTEIFHNTNVWSFDVNECQVDFILVSAENIGLSHSRHLCPTEIKEI